MRVAVTGGCGYLGRVVCDYLHAADFEVLAIDVIPPAKPPPYHVALVDLLDSTLLPPLFAGIEAVVHLANIPGVAKCPDRRRLYNENVSLNANVFYAALAGGARCIVEASSIQVIAGTRRCGNYQTQPSCLQYLPLDSDTPTCPGNIYAVSKHAGELLLAHLAQTAPHLSTTVVRFPLLSTTGALRWNNAHHSDPARDFGPMADEGYAHLSLPEAARLVRCLVEHAPPGFRTILPAMREPWLAWPLDRIVAEYYPDVPLRRPVSELVGLVDTSAITTLCGWAPP